MKKKPIIINSVFVVSIATPNLQELYNHLENEERFYDMTVGKPLSGHVVVQLKVRQDDAPYFSNLLNTVRAIQV